MLYALTALMAFLIAFRLSRSLANPTSRLYIADLPNERSLHVQPRPRNGGLGIMAGFLPTWMVLFGWLDHFHLPGGWLLLTALLVIMGTSLWDDKSSLSPGVRLLSHLSAAALIILGGFSLDSLSFPGMDPIPLGWFGPIFSLLFIVWFLNLYNFMDGMDGFAGGMGMFGFGFFALLGWLGGHPFFFATALLLSAANAGFLVNNFPPARIFMGDVGSVPMGFLAAALTFWADRDHLFAPWVGVLIFSPFVVDATVTLIRRILRREKIWQAHRSHFYQRLVLVGWNHRKTVLHEYALMIAMGGGAVYLARHPQALIQWVGLLICCLLFVWLAVAVDRQTAPKKPHTSP
ncbi:MAG: glycosyltransferase family 4 protein [Magnetococcales bacterium]|nr:glycosyltransferase family 4 protein [Magnetococcales bacterium]